MTGDASALRDRIEALSALPGAAAAPDDLRATLDALLSALEHGTIRAAQRTAAGVWRAVPWVKQGILLAFRAGAIREMSPRDGPFRFFDKDTLPVRPLTLADGVRIVPGGSTIRRGAFVARGVVCMPPMYVNVGAYVGAATMVDSHALVGSCAQIGERVHLSAAVQVGGVLEPINATPVVIEDDVFVGGNCGIYEGTTVRARAVLAPGVLLTRGTPVYDLVHETVHRATSDAPLEIPSGAVVVPGARAVQSAWGREHGLSLYAAVIVKYRDPGTDAATTLEQWLR